MNRSLIALIAGVVIAGASALYFQGERSKPATSGNGKDNSQLNEGDPIVAVMLPEQLDEKSMIGKRAFDAKCASCHGANAAGQNGIAPPLVHKIYEPSHHGDESFQLAVKAGVRAHHWTFGNMMPVEGLTRGDVSNIIAYVRTLQRENGIN